MAIALGLSSVIGSVAWAVSSQYSTSFSSIVCSDGWAGCIFDGDEVHAGSVTDSKGFFHPANARVSFMDFSPLPGFSPFALPEEYPERKQVVAVVEEPSAEPSPKIDSNTDKNNSGRNNSGKNPSNNSSNSTKIAIGGGGTPNQNLVVPEPSQPAQEPVVEPSQPAQEPVVEPTAEPSDEGGCTDLFLLEASAMSGSLNSDQKTCIESRVTQSGVLLTEKRKLSVVLLNDAQNAQNWTEWDRLAGRHLQYFDQSDPTLCMMYAARLSKKGVSSAAQVIKWSETALENKTQWSGDEYKKNVSMLYNLRANAAQALWDEAEKSLMEERSDANVAKVEKYRGQTKNFAREWLDYARLAGQPVKKPQALCVSATQGDLDFCK